MNKNQDYEQPIDPVLIEKINLMRPTPERDPKLLANGRERFLSEIEAFPAASSRSSLAWLTSLFKSKSPGNNSLSLKNRKFAISTLAAIIIVVVMLFGGASVTAYASQSALPGDALYPVKTSLELTQISLANDAYQRAQLNLDFAQRRLNEIIELLAQGRTNDVDFASNEFERFIQEAMKATQTVLATDPERGAELSRLVSQALLDYATALKSVLVNAPEVVKPAVEKALLLSQDGVGDEMEIIGVVESISDSEVGIDGKVYLINELTEIKDMIQAGDTIKVQVIMTADGTMIAREIELSSSLGEGISEFGDDNSNSNDALSNNNGNENENFNDNSVNENESNENLNDNESEDNSNENSSEENKNNNESNDNQNSDESDDDDNENKSKDNENKSKDDGNKNESDDDKNNNDNDD